MSQGRVLGLALGLIVGLLAPSLGRTAEAVCSTCHQGGTGSSHHALSGYSCSQRHGSAPVAGTCASCHPGPSTIHHTLPGYWCDTYHPGSSALHQSPGQQLRATPDNRRPQAAHELLLDPAEHHMTDDAQYV